MTEEQQKLLQRLYTEQQMTESNIGMTQQRLEAIQVYLTNYRSGLMVLEEIEKKEEGEEMLINVGGSIFVEAKLVNPSKVTRGLGSGVRIEQSVESAKEIVSDAVKSLEEQYGAIEDALMTQKKAQAAPLYIEQLKQDADIKVMYEPSEE